MKALLLRIAVLILLSAAFFVPEAKSQDYKEWELFGGFSYYNFNAGSVPLGNRQNFVLQQDSYGWHVTRAENKTRWFGGIADLSGNYADRVVNFGTAQSPLIVRFNASIYPFLFGPRFYFRHFGRSTLFGDTLIGRVRSRVTVSGDTTPVTETVSETKWAYAFGGGADYNLTDRFAIRVQSDWIRSHFPETQERDFQNIYRVSVGIVFKFGGR
jgi:opacity protein-like surface antigen